MDSTHASTGQYTASEPTTVRRSRRSSAVQKTVLGQAVAALGLLIQWAADPALFWPPGFPPGLLFVGGAAAIVWLDRRSAWSPLAAVVMSLWITVGGLMGGDLQKNLGSGDVGLVAGNVVMELGLLFSAVAGCVAVAANRRDHAGTPQVKPLSRENPRRTAVLVVTGGLLADAIGDAAPEGLVWDGPGPVLFLGLAVAVALVPGRFMTLLAMPLCGAFVVGCLTNPEPLQALATPSDPLPFVGILVQLAGLTTALLAGVFVVRPDRPRRRTAPAQ